MKNGTQLTIRSLREDHPVYPDLVRLGFLPGESLLFGPRPLWGDPVMVSLRDRWYLLRRAEIEAMDVEEIK